MNYRIRYTNNAKVFKVVKDILFLLFHSTMHTLDKLYKCDVCCNMFTNNPKLRVHLRIHTGEKTFKYDVCSNTFIQSSSLQALMRIHTREEPYNSHVYCKMFNNNVDLRKNK